MAGPEVEAIRMFASHEGLLLDPVYTGRAAAGMIDLIRKGFFDQKQKVLFWHTGGTRHCSRNLICQCCSNPDPVGHR